MNEFFRCPKWFSGTLVLVVLLSVIVFIVACIDRTMGQFVNFLGQIGLFCWFLWCVANIVQAKQCYVGFKGNNGLTYLNPISGMFQNSKENPKSTPITTSETSEYMTPTPAPTAPPPYNPSADIP